LISSLEKDCFENLQDLAVVTLVDQRLNQAI
jgi:hypothetical protein